jgi:large subunit ribosomal protein L10
MTVLQMMELRKRLAAIQAEFHVIKNSFFKIVAIERNWMKSDEPLTEPNAIAIGKGDAISLAKVLSDFNKEHKRPVIRRGFLEGKALSAVDIEYFLTLPSKDILRAMLVGAIAAPMTGLVGALKQKLSSIVYVLKAIEEKKKIISK